jgi:hypothetical protein
LDSVLNRRNLTILVLLTSLRNFCKARYQWFTPIILATWEAEIWITVQGQPRQVMHETLSPKYPTKKWAAEGLMW